MFSCHMKDRILGTIQIWKKEGMSSLRPRRAAHSSTGRNLSPGQRPHSMQAHLHLNIFCMAPCCSWALWASDLVQPSSWRHFDLSQNSVPVPEWGPNIGIRCGNRVSMPGCDKTVSSLISSGAIHSLLLPHLEPCELQRLENVSKAFRQLSESLAEGDWRAFASCLVPATHYLARANTGDNLRLQ